MLLHGDRWHTDGVAAAELRGRVTVRERHHVVHRYSFQVEIPSHRENDNCLENSRENNSSSTEKQAVGCSGGIGRWPITKSAKSELVFLKKVSDSV